jgi:F-type H+-transporting ATPase subunit epsilon
MINKIIFKIVTPEKTVLEEEIEQATLPVADGEVTILPNHQSYIGALKAGEIMVKREGREEILAVSGGFAEFNANNLTILADTAERAGEIDVARAEEGRKRAEVAMKEKVSMDDTEYARVAAAIEKEMARIKVAKKHLTRKGLKLED